MLFENLNWLAIVTAMLVGFAVNMAYFNGKTMYPLWVRALGRDPQQQEGEGATGMGLTFGLTVVALFTQAVVLAAVLGVFAASGAESGWWQGLAVGALIGVAFAAAPSLGHRLFSGQGLKVWLIEVGADIAGLAAMGLILGAWR